MQVSLPPLVEVMRGDSVTLDCKPLGTPEHFVLEWFLADRSGNRHFLASAERKGSRMENQVKDSQSRNPSYQLDSRGRLVLAETQVTDERDYVCVVRADSAGTAEASTRLHVFAKPEATQVTPNTGTLSVMETNPQQIAICKSLNGNPAPQIMWYRNGQRLEVPMEVNADAYMTSRTVREASGLQSLTSVLYLRLHKEDRESSFHCAVQFRLPNNQIGQLDSAPFRLTLHYPTEHVQFWVGSPATTEGWVREGDSVHLICRGDGSPSPEYTFFRLQDNQENTLKTNLEGNLTLEGVQRGQSGTYGCRVEDYDAPEDAELSQTLELRVAYLDPLELSTGEELIVPLGGSATANCSVGGLPTPTLRWTKDSVPLENGPVLSLSDVTFDATGTYTCEASMPTVPLLSRTQSFKLLVQGIPELRPEETQPQIEGSWREGDEVTLTCSARGHPEPKITWTQLGGSPAESTPGSQGWVSSSLRLKVTSALSREGVSCEAANPHGSKHHVFHFRDVAPQAAQAGVAVLAVTVSVGLLLLVVAAFYCMRRKGRPGCCRRSEKGAPPPGEPELSQNGAEPPEQTGLLKGGPSGAAQRGSGAYRETC